MKKYLVCVDSDGCAMDTMDCKHKLCFGPEMVKAWGLEAYREEVLKLWSQISLYSETRGINRFPGLELTMKACMERGILEEDISDFSLWLKESPSFSNVALEKRIEETGSPLLKKILQWSLCVNAAIKALPDSSPFNGVRETLEYMSQYADLAVVSSANREALEREWGRTGLISLVKEIMAQDCGSKSVCISRLLEQGYEKDCVLMIGDAPGDGTAADKCGVLFFPVVIQEEEQSWKCLKDQAFQRFLDRTYKGEYEKEQRHKFMSALKQK